MGVGVRAHVHVHAKANTRRKKKEKKKIIMDAFLTRAPACLRAVGSTLSGV